MVPATNLSLATVDRAKRPQKLGYGTHSGYERAREQQVTRPQIRPLVTTTPCAGHHATLRVDIGPAEDLSSTQWTGHEEHQEQATEQRVFRRQQQCGAPVRHLSTIQSTIHSHGWTGSRSIKAPANVCDVPRQQAFGQNGIISTRIEHRASACYSPVPHNTADTQTALPTVAPQTIGEGLVTLHRMTKPEEIRARALMPSNSDACWSGTPFLYR